MNILFLTRNDPEDINIWSGTLYYIYHQLRQKHHVEVMGVELLGQLCLFGNGNFPKGFIITSDRYVKNLGKILSERINIHKFDLLFLGDLYFIPLDIHIPFIHFSDMTYEQVKIHLAEPEDRKSVEVGMSLEKLVLNSSFKMIYCSEWIKHKALETYHIDENYIKLRASSRYEFETRLNWDIWGECVNRILENTVKEWNVKNV